VFLFILLCFMVSEVVIIGRTEILEQFQFYLQNRKKKNNFVFFFPHVCVCQSVLNFSEYR